MTIVCLGGGIGATRLWRALAEEVGQESLTIVVNTADDLWHHGLRISPDIDTVIYGLSGAQDQVRGWGLRGESFTAMETLRQLGEDVWFNLGDRDLATHLLRTGLLRRGWSLTRVVAHLAAARQVRARVLPMCDNEVATQVLTTYAGWVPFQEFHVKHQARLAAEAVRYVGIEDAKTSPEVLDAIASASLVILGPSSPVASVLPILGVGTTRNAIRETRAPVVGVSPVVAGVKPTNAGDIHRARCRERLMGARGLPHTAGAVVELYQDLLDAFILDECDADELPRVESLEVKTVVAPTLLHVHEDAAKRLTSSVLEFARTPDRDMSSRDMSSTVPGVERG